MCLCKLDVAFTVCRAKTTPRRLPRGEDAARTAAADRELSARLRVVSEKIKAVAKQIESL